MIFDSIKLLNLSQQSPFFHFTFEGILGIEKLFCKIEGKNERNGLLAKVR